MAATSRRKSERAKLAFAMDGERLSSVLAEQHLRQSEAKLRKQLLRSPELLNLSEEKRRLLAHDCMARYQRGVCEGVLDALTFTDAAAARSIDPDCKIVDWTLQVDKRRFSTRHKEKEIQVLLLPANSAAFSQILAQMRSDSIDSLRKLSKPNQLSRDAFSTFFFSVRSLFGAWAKRRLFAIHLLLPRAPATHTQTTPTTQSAATQAAPTPPPKGVDLWLCESFVVGFVQAYVCEEEPQQVTRPLPRKRKRPEKENALWVDLFEIFGDFRRYGIGRRAAQLLPQLIDSSFSNHLPRPASIRLNPLESAEPFWRACGFKAQDKDNNDGPFIKLIS